MKVQVDCDVIINEQVVSFDVNCFTIWHLPSEHLDLAVFHDIGFVGGAFCPLEVGLPCLSFYIQKVHPKQ